MRWRRFVARLPQGLSGGRYAPRGFAVYAGPFRSQPQKGAAPIVWPLKRDLATAGKLVSSGLGYRCMSVTGKPAQILLATLRKANEQSQWTARAEHEQHLPGDRAPAAAGPARLRLSCKTRADAPLRLSAQRAALASRRASSRPPVQWPVRRGWSYSE